MTDTKTILLTGATDGIGKHAAFKLAQQGHQLLLHGRNEEKLDTLKRRLSNLTEVSCYRADFSNLDQVVTMARQISESQTNIDAIINNAGVLKVSQNLTDSGLDIRMVVNCIAPYLLTRKLFSLLSFDGRVLNISSAAQAEVDFSMLDSAPKQIDDMKAYAQSKLALMMWTFAMANQQKDVEPKQVFVSINPGSLLGSKMVKEGFGIEGKDINIGADILVRAVNDDAFLNASGKYFDNDKGRFGQVHAHATDQERTQKLLHVLDKLIEPYASHS